MASQTPGVFVEVARNGEELKRYVADWDALAQDALEPNPFFESGALLAAIHYLGLPGPLCCVLVYRAATARAGARLIAFAPFVRTAKGPRGIVSCYRTLTHLHCFLSTPLVHREHVDDALDALLTWMDGAPDGVRTFGFYKIAGDGPLATTLYRRMEARRQPHFTELSYERAFLRVGSDAQGSLVSAIPTKKRKELARQRRRLEELGNVTLTDRVADPDAFGWMDRFLALEAKGWKGQSGNAFNRTSKERAYFLAFIEHFRARGRAMFLDLRLEGREIAMKCNLVAASGGGSFAFKIAHDMDFARYSPGVLLELDNIRVLHEPARGIAWMDSCAKPDHPMIDHLWRERRRIVYLTCCGRGFVGWFLIALFRWRKLRQERAEG
ncbi:MAG: GNAT family N-acetyltransferase [Betaproteobacteria bacterium]